MSRPSLLATSLFVISALSACGGGGGGDDSGGSGGTTTAYTEFSQRGVDRNSDLGGHVLITGTTTEIRQIEASLNHFAGALSGFTDGTNTLSDADGDTSGTWTDGTVTLQPSAAQQGSYEYVALYNLIVPSSAGETLVIGVTTAASDIPTSGTTTFTGEAFIDGSTTDPAGPSLTSTGTASLNVDFAGSANLTITGVSGVPYDSITITGMSLDSSARNTFSGGTLAILDGVTDVTDDLIGAGASFDAEGSFFGADSAGAPDEAGGVFAAEGTNGEAYGGFLVD